VDRGVVTGVGIGLTAVGAPQFVAPEAEDILRGRRATEESFAAAGRLAAIHCRPSADQRGPVDYKRHLAGELTVRALRRAAARAGGEP
jgi:aerobic carbon-monoxide dehydrogenase medium subunit